MVAVVDDWSAAVSTGGTSVVGTEPTGSASGDLLIAALVTDGVETGLTAPDGTWTNLVDEYTNGGGDSPTLSIWYQERGGSAPDYDAFTWDTTETAVLHIYRISGHDSTTPFDGVSPAHGTAAPSATVTCPSVTVGTANTLVFRINSVDFYTALDTGATNGGYPAGHTQGGDTDSGGSGSSGQAFAYETGPSSGATGADDFVRDNNRDQHGTTFVIREDAGGGGRTTRNTRGFTLGMSVGMNWRGNL